MRRVEVDVAREPRPCLVVREKVAAFPQEHLVEQRLDLGGGQGGARPQLVEVPAGRRLQRDRAGLPADQSRADVAEIEGVADAGADPAQDLGDSRAPR